MQPCVGLMLKIKGLYQTWKYDLAPFTHVRGVFHLGEQAVTSTKSSGGTEWNREQLEEP